jgi:hypothetical protein
MRDVMEVLDTVNDEIEKEGDASNEDEEVDEEEESDNSGVEDVPRYSAVEKEDSTDRISTPSKPKELIPHTDCDPSASEASDNEKGGSSTKNPVKKVTSKTKELLESHNASDDGSRGALAQIKDYKDHRKRLHRKHRGIMQWKAARTGDWALHKLLDETSRVGEVFEHHEKDVGIETEV